MIQLYAKCAEKEVKTFETAGYVSSVNITNTGLYHDDGILNYFNASGNPIPEFPPTITFSAPQVGIDAATGTPIIEGEGHLVGINITNPGSDYTTALFLFIRTKILFISSADDTRKAMCSGFQPKNSIWNGLCWIWRVDWCDWSVCIASGKKGNSHGQGPQSMVW